VEAPDLVGYITGLRAWRYAETDMGWRLQSAIQNLIWPTQERLEAECLVLKMPTHPMVPSPRPIPHQDPPPYEPCKCGFWGLADPNELYVQYGRRAIKTVGPDSERYVYGTIALWGRVVTGTKGWRSQYAFPLALVQEAASLNNRGLLDRLAETYGIPVMKHWPEASELGVGGNELSR
jgi:hypothetical protein